MLKRNTYNWIPWPPFLLWFFVGLKSKLQNVFLYLNFSFSRFEFASDCFRLDLCPDMVSMVTDSLWTHCGFVIFLPIVRRWNWELEVLFVIFFHYLSVNFMLYFSLSIAQVGTLLFKFQMIMVGCASPIFICYFKVIIKLVYKFELWRPFARYIVTSKRGFFFNIYNFVHAVLLDNHSMVLAWRLLTSINN